MRILFVCCASLLVCSLVGCGGESEQILAPDVAPGASENSGFATGADAAPAAPALSKIILAQWLSWHALPQTDRNQKILDRAYKDLGKYLGDPEDWRPGQCKTWVQDVVFAASNGAVQLPLNHPEKDRWIDDPENTDSEYCIGRCGPITSARPGEIVQVRWKTSFSAPPRDLHTFIVVSVNATTITVIDSNWIGGNEIDRMCYREKTVREHSIDISTFNDNAKSFTIYSIR